MHKLDGRVVQPAGPGHHPVSPQGAAGGAGGGAAEEYTNVGAQCASDRQPARCTTEVRGEDRRRTNCPKEGRLVWAALREPLGRTAARLPAMQ